MDWGAAIGIVGTLAAIVFGYIALVRNRKADIKSDAKESAECVKQDAVLLSEIGYIKANTEEIKSEQREQRKTNLEVLTRLTAVEQSAKQAHKRIDGFEGRAPRSQIK